MARNEPSQGAAAVIFDSDGRVLLVREAYDRRRWSLPGGALEAGETPEDAAARETFEETGLHVSIEHHIGTYTLDNGFTAHAFRCVILDGEPQVPSSGEIDEVAWWSAKALPTPRSNILHHAVPDAIAGARGVERTHLPRIS